MIHNVLINHVKEKLQKALIDDIPAGDTARGGVVKVGPLQGDPDPDVARISVEVYFNDPDQTISGSGMGAAPEAWDDQVEEIEVGGVITWKRRFTVKARVLLDRTREGLGDAHVIAATVRSRLERALLFMTFSDIGTDDEYVARGVTSDALRGEMIQAGGPPDSYDFHIKLRFDVLTTEKAGV